MSATPKHTPGPWRVRREDASTWLVESDDYGRIVSLHHAYGLPEQNEEADAHLIAAAPEMYEALRLAQGEMVTLVARLSDPYRKNVRGALDAVTAALAKAEGR